jgi:hypothetical protein
MKPDKRKKALAAWLKTRPAIIRKVASKLPPWNLYKMKDTGQHCRLYSYSEDGTVTVTIVGHENAFQNEIAQMFAHNVFGVSPTDLEVIPTP